MNLTSRESKQFLQKVAQFTKLSLHKIENLEDALQEFKDKQAFEETKQQIYTSSLYKVAKILYDADYLMDRDEQRKFIKRSEQDPTYLIQVITKMAQMNDVSQLGKMSTAKKNSEEYDPIMAKIRGENYNSSLIE